MINKSVSSGNIKHMCFWTTYLYQNNNRDQKCFTKRLYDTRIKTQQFKWPAWIDLIIENTIK